MIKGFIPNENILFEEHVRFDKLEGSLIIYQSSLAFFGNKKNTIYDWNDILGATSCKINSFDTIILYSYPKGKKRKLLKHTIVSKSPEMLIKIIQCLCNNKNFADQSENIYKKKFLILINPASGRRRGLKIWSQVSEFFDACDIEIHLTEYRNHANEIIINANILDFDGIVVVSGDGLVHEVINALCNSNNERIRSIPVGVIPAGSGNALAKVMCVKINEEVSPSTCAFICIKGQRTCTDISYVEFASGKIVYSFLCIFWGILADIDIESEKLRCCGGLRFELYALQRIIFLRRNIASLSWTGSNAGSYHGPLIYFAAINMPYVGENFKFAPLAKIDDGQTDILYLGDVGRIPLVRVLLRQNSGNHIGANHLHYIKTTEFELNPNGGILSIDGELYPAENLKVRVLPQYSNIIALA